MHNVVSCESYLFVYSGFPGDYQFQIKFVNALGKESKSMKLRESMRISGLGVSFDKFMNSIQVKVGKNKIYS